MKRMGAKAHHRCAMPPSAMAIDRPAVRRVQPVMIAWRQQAPARAAALLAGHGWPSNLCTVVPSAAQPCVVSRALFRDG